MKTEATRWSGADWSSEKREIMIIGIGGIGSWLSLNLSRIGHNLYLVDPDNVDSTNVSGGQMYRKNDIGNKKVSVVHYICRQFGALNSVDGIDDYFTKDTGIVPVVLTGLDNMDGRKTVWKEWIAQVNNAAAEKADTGEYILLDGRLLMEQLEIFTIRGNDEAAIKEYEERWLFDDSEVEDAACTTKQSTFAAMIIAGLMTSTLCNWLTNRKLGMEFREVPFHQSLYLPTFMHKIYSPKSEEITIESVKQTIENGTAKETKSEENKEVFVELQGRNQRVEATG